VEFDWLKLSALLLLLFVHSNLYDAFPGVIHPIKWILISDFFFVSGFLAFESFHKRGTNIKSFFKSKILSLYIPFAVAATLYFFIEIAAGVVAKGDPLRLLSQVSMLDIFDKVNSGSYNLGFLWFIPYLLVFMFIFCVLEKYVKSAKYQVLIVSFLWFCTILAWVFNVPMKLGKNFSQYLLVFTIGFWLSKLRIYEKVMRFRTAYVAVPLVALFSIDLSGLFNENTAIETLMSLLYSNARSIVLSLSVILLVLLFLRKIKIPKNRYVELIAETSIFIYLSEPFFSYGLRRYVFGQPIIYFASGADFYLYVIMRGAILFVLLPLVYKVIKNWRASR
jgi:hypothetical protein